MNYSKKRTSKILKQIKFHTCILARGIFTVLYGALIAGLFVVSIVGFILVTIDSGYAAVCDFIVSSATFVIALVNTYWIGIKRKDGKR